MTELPGCPWWDSGGSTGRDHVEGVESINCHGELFYHGTRVHHVGFAL